MFDALLSQSLIFFYLDENLCFESLSYKAEYYLKRSVSGIKSKHISEIFPENHTLLSLLYERQNTTIYDIAIFEPFEIAERFDVHIYGQDERRLVLFYPRSRAETLNQTDAAGAAMRRISALSATFAHEVRNPLSAIAGAAQLLGQTVNAADRELTQMIEDEVLRIERLVREYESLASPSPKALSEVNLHAVLDRAVMSAQTGFAKNIPIAKDYDPSLPEIVGNDDQLYQAIYNIIKNAAEAILDQNHMHGRIHITTRYRAGVRRKHALPIELKISDNGGGIAKAMITQMFEPFFTTKSYGTGIGLSVVAHMVESFGGVIEFQNIFKNDEKGAEFTILFPKWSKEWTEQSS